ncbi:hypothetical protein CEXT_466281 [Caerostris extrusa]|uniref:Uncharacterized protein n=1 Tax=Caerostris extrusa TaxID=172846 RepID=A0AAV4WUB6_CAEEX|nr:hypothetical protein CEXT_466281 [Caerostris extrusa]
MIFYGFPILKNNLFQSRELHFNLISVVDAIKLRGEPLKRLIFFFGRFIYSGLWEGSTSGGEGLSIYLTLFCFSDDLMVGVGVAAEFCNLLQDLTDENL